MIPLNGQADSRIHLNRDVIVSCAMAIADAEGIDAITIRRLAQELNVTAMAPYRHFRDKEDLLNGIAEKLLANVNLPETAPRAWDQDLAQVLGQLVAALRLHPSVAELVLTRILLSVPGLTLAELVFKLLADAGFGSEQVGQIGSYALGSLVALVTTQPGAVTSPDPEIRDALLRKKRISLASLSPRNYPHIVAAADTLVSCTDDDAYYALGVKLVIEGIKGVKSDLSDQTDSTL
ncbi:MAG: TetR/AcrR family transcriptional regulator [Ferrimicrobium sp.]